MTTQPGNISEANRLLEIFLENVERAFLEHVAQTIFDSLLYSLLFSTGKEASECI
jgi:hypothetical protein